MKKYTMVRIQSFVDVITNSSTSIYTFYDQNGINTIKNSLSDIIHAFDPKVNIDDVLDIKLVYSEAFLDWVESHKDELFDEDESNEDLLLNYSGRLDELATNFCNDWYENGWAYDIEINAKDPKYSNLVSSVFSIIAPFEQEATYN